MENIDIKDGLLAFCTGCISIITTKGKMHTMMAKPIANLKFINIRRLPNIELIVLVHIPHSIEMILSASIPCSAG